MVGIAPDFGEVWGGGESLPEDHSWGSVFVS